jgi:ABC-2 type transport system permease protein
MKKELTFLLALWKANLISAMEFRVSFITQIAGMMLNNLIYFFFWVLFFQRFQEVRGWVLGDMLVLFGVTASGIGLSTFLFGNLTRIAEVIASGRLDYYLSFPRPVLLHLLASHSIPSGLGDFTYGILSFIAAGQWSLEGLLRFFLGVFFSMAVFLSFLILVQSLAFWLGNTQLLAQQVYFALITFSLYPLHLFDGTAKLLLFTVLPAAFVGAIPAEFIRSFSLLELLQMSGGAGIFLILALLVFHRGLMRYESGSAIQVQA